MTTSKKKTKKKAAPVKEQPNLSGTIEEMTDSLIAGETKKQEEEEATLTVEKGGSQDLTVDYDMIEVLHQNIIDNTESARKAIPMLSKKGLQRVLTRLLESGMIEDELTTIKFQGNLEPNIYEFCNQIEMDKRGLVLKVQEESIYESIRVKSEEYKKQQEEGAANE